MILLDMEIEEMTGGKVLAALGAAINMSLEVMYLIILVGGKRQSLPVRRERTVHDLSDWGIR